MKPYHILLRDLMKQTDNMIRSLQDYKEEIQEEYDDYCKQKQEQNDDTADHSAFVLGKTAERALKIAHGLGVKLFIVGVVPSLCKLEFISREVFVFLCHVCHFYFAPILILGSMKP